MQIYSCENRHCAISNKSLGVLFKCENDTLYKGSFAED